MVLDVAFYVAGSPSQPPGGVDLSAAGLVGPMDVAGKEKSELPLGLEGYGGQPSQGRKKKQARRKGTDHSDDFSRIRAWTSD